VAKDEKKEIIKKMAYIKAISYYLPEKIVTNGDLVDDFPEWNVEKIANKVGVESRHVTGENETAGDMAEKVARKLFDENSIDPMSIDFLLLCTQSPDYILPSTACILQDRLGIPSTAGAFDYNLGCSGCIYGMAIAKGLISAGIAKNILLLTSETYNKYLHEFDKGNRSIFGDGAAACLISTEGFAEIGEFVLGTDGSGYDKLIVRTGGARHFEKMNDLKFDENGNPHSSDFLFMDGPAIFNFTLEVVPPLVNNVLTKNYLTKDQISMFVFHQANSYILTFLKMKLKIDDNKFFVNLVNSGNTVSSTILIALCELKEQRKLKGNLLLAGFGVGLSWGGVIIKASQFD